MTEEVQTYDALVAYEEKMFKRAEEAGREAAALLEMCLSVDGAARFAAMMRSKGFVKPLGAAFTKASFLHRVPSASWQT